MNAFIIDTNVKGHKNLINKLKRLKTTKSVYFGGVYQMDPNLCQVKLITIWNEETLEKWLYDTKCIDYIGVSTFTPTDDETY